MVLFIKDENRMKDLWKKGVVTKVIRSQADGRPRTVQLRTTTGTITRPVQKLAIPESQIIEEEPGEEDIIQSDSITIPIEDIAVPEIFNKPDIVQYLKYCNSTNNALKNIAKSPEKIL